MRYQGGKSRIAKQIAVKIRELHPTATEIWEPFCGGGAVTLALAKTDFEVHASDTHEDLILMWQAMVVGDTSVFTDVTEVEYRALKTAPPSARRGFVGFGASFGGGWWAGFGRDRKNGDGHQPYQEAQRSVQKLRQYAEVGWMHFVLADFRTVPDEALAYCDPPYRDTKLYTGQRPFDHDAFWAWVRQRSGPTFVSELQGPEDMQIVWRQGHKSQQASNSPTTKNTSVIIEREERLYYKPARLSLDYLRVGAHHTARR